LAHDVEYGALKYPGGRERKNLKDRWFDAVYPPGLYEQELENLIFMPKYSLFTGQIWSLRISRIY
jgi:hypothetical protein